MACKGCGRAWCRCRIADSDCIVKSGSGNPGDPIQWDYKLSEDPDNDVVITSDGLLMLPRPSLSQPLYFKGRFGPPGLDFDPLVSLLTSYPMTRRVPVYQETVYNTGGMFDADSGTFTCPRAGLWEIGMTGELLDRSDEFGNEFEVAFGLSLNNQYTIAREGPFEPVGVGAFLVASPVFPIVIHEELEVGDEVQAFIDVTVEGVLVESCEFWGGFIGE